MRRVALIIALTAAFAGLPAASQAATILSSFTADGEGWSLASGAPSWVSTGGNPGGFLVSTTPAGGSVGWRAPAKFLGNRGIYYGGVLRVDRKPSGGSVPAADVVLAGAGKTVRLPLPAQPAWGWKRQEVQLLPTAAADEPTLRAVLGALGALEVQAAPGLDAAVLDNVRLTNSLVAPAITSTGSATLKVGTAAKFTVRATGTPFPVLTIAGGLPAGVRFTDNRDGTGTLSGTPAAGSEGAYRVTVSAASRIGTAVQTLSLEVNRAPAITSAATATFLTGSENAFTVRTVGRPVPRLAQVKPLPAGVTFTDNGNGTGTLRGTPAGAGKFALKFDASSAAGTSTQAFTLVTQAPSALASLFPYRARTNYSGFDQTFPTTPEGPWDAAACVNNGYSLTNGGVDAASGLPDAGVVVGRFEVRQGDRGSETTGGDRCELGVRNRQLLGEGPFESTGGTATQGEVRFYRLSFGVGKDFPAFEEYTTFAQWHQPRVGRYSPLSVVTLDEGSAYVGVVLRQIVRGEPAPNQFLVQFPTPRGRWADLVVELNLSPDPALGYVRLWLDGRRIDEATSPTGAVDGVDDDTFHAATLYSTRVGDVDWALDFKLGNYRSALNVAPSTVYHRFTKIARTYESAAASPFAVAPPPGVRCAIGNLPTAPAPGQVYRPLLQVTNDEGAAVAGAKVLVRARVATLTSAGATSATSEEVVPVTIPPAGGATTVALPQHVVGTWSSGTAAIVFSAAAEGRFACTSRRIGLPAASAG